MRQRKIIHIDVDAFYASVELREQPHLRGKLVIVAWEGSRPVICAASYEARQFSLCSAVSAATVKRLCPQAVYVPSHFDLCRNISTQVHGIFRHYTTLIEPLSLDETYLNTTDNLQQIPYASDVAEKVRTEILIETGLTTSAGVTPSKFLAKIASDWCKPNGQFVLPPRKAAAFLEILPLGKIPDVGKVTLKRMQSLGMRTADDLRRFKRGELLNLFGRYGHRLYDLARGVGERPVEPDHERLQISIEITLPEDLSLAQAAGHLSHLTEDLWRQMQCKDVEAKSVTLKLKTHDFRIITRSLTYSSVLPGSAVLLRTAQMLAGRISSQRKGALRLIGLSVTHLVPKDQQQSLWLWIPRRSGGSVISK